MKFTDSHCHLDFNEFSHVMAELLTDCEKRNIHQIVVPSVSPDNWQQVLHLANQIKISKEINCKLLPCLGIHPWYLKQCSANALEQLTLAVHTHLQDIVAIGETGIDGIIAEQQNNLSQQLKFFEYHLQLAKEVNKPIIIHHRKSHQHIVPLLKKYQPQTGVIHAFSGSFQQAKQYIDLGFKLGIGGTITYERAQKTIKTVKKLPLSSIVLETDAPSMPLQGFQGQNNSPIHLIDVFKTLCIIRAESNEIIAKQIELNNKEIFNL